MFTTDGVILLFPFYTAPWIIHINFYFIVYYIVSPFRIWEYWYCIICRCCFLQIYLLICIKDDLMFVFIEITNHPYIYTNAKYGDENRKTHTHSIVKPKKFWLNFALPRGKVLTVKYEGKKWKHLYQSVCIRKGMMMISKNREIVCSFTSLFVRFFVFFFLVKPISKINT